MPLKINPSFVEKVLCAFIREELHKFGFRRGSWDYPAAWIHRSAPPCGPGARRKERRRDDHAPIKETFGSGRERRPGSGPKLGIRTCVVDISPMVDAYFTRYPTPQPGPDREQDGRGAHVHSLRSVR